MGIFDQSFITPEPKTDIKNQLIALAMRNEAMNPEKFLTGLGEIGKVFTDAEKEQQKANTAILQRRLDMLTPAQIEAMVAQGIDPVTEAYKRNIPINVDDAAINKAWRDNIVDAQKEQGNKWVTTVLPSIPHEDKLKLLEGDTAIYTKWGLTDFMRMDPNLRTFIYDNIKSAADRENELLYYRTKLPVKGYLEKGEFPSSIFANNPDANPNGALPIAQMTQDDTAVQTAANTANQTDASLGLLDSNTLGTDDNRVTRLNAHAKALADLFLVEQNTTGNPNLTIDEFLQQKEPSFKEDYGISDPAEIAKLKQLVKDSLSNPDNTNRWRERVNLSTPPRDESVLDTVASQEEAINEIDAFNKIKNTKAATAKEDNLKRNINNIITEDFFSELYEAAENGATKRQLESMLRDGLNGLSSIKNKCSPTLYKYYEEAFKSLYQPFIDQAADTAEQREKNMQESRSQAKQQLISDGNSIVGKSLRANGNLSDLPANFKKLNNDVLDTIKGAFLKNPKLDAYWTGADDFTKRLIIWETLNKAGILNELSDIASDSKKFLERIKENHFYKTGINDESFIQRIERIAHMDINNSRKNQLEEEKMLSTVATDATR